MYKNLADAFLSFVQIAPFYIPITRKGKVIEFGSFKNDYDEVSGMIVHHSVARLDKGIPNPKERPMLELPWEVEFTVKLFKNPNVDETMLRTAFQTGGVSLGLGTYRGQFGKFLVEKWE
jgi:hypothetical protein